MYTLIISASLLAVALLPWELWRPEILPEEDSDILIPPPREG